MKRVAMAFGCIASSARRGVINLVVDSASIEVKRHGRHRKTDRLDSQKLLSMLLRYFAGEPGVWSVVRVPSPADDIRHLHRDLMELKAERTRHSNRIKGLLAGIGVDLKEVDDRFPTRLAEIRTWEEAKVLPELRKRLLREYQRWQLVNRQIREVENERERRLRTSRQHSLAKVRQLLTLRGIGGLPRRLSGRLRAVSNTCRRPIPGTSGGRS